MAQLCLNSKKRFFNIRLLFLKKKKNLEYTYSQLFETKETFNK